MRKTSPPCASCFGSRGRSKEMSLQHRSGLKNAISAPRRPIFNQIVALSLQSQLSRLDKTLYVDPTSWNHLGNVLLHMVFVAVLCIMLWFSWASLGILAATRKRVIGCLRQVAGALERSGSERLAERHRTNGEELPPRSSAVSNNDASSAFSISVR